MIDQSHNLKGKIEAMVQTVVTAQELYLKAALVDREQLAELAAVLRPGGRRRAVPRRILAGCAPAGGGLARGARPARRSAGCAARQRLCGARRTRARKPPLGGEQLCVKADQRYGYATLDSLQLSDSEMMQRSGDKRLPKTKIKRLYLIPILSKALDVIELLEQDQRR